MAKSFKDYYKEDETPKTRKKVAEEVTSVSGKAEPVVTSPVLATVVSEDISTAVKEVMVEQKLQTEALVKQGETLLESITKVNQEISSNVSKLVESTNDVNAKLLEAIVKLAEKVEMLEGKLDEIKHLEIPTPIVNLQMPSKKTVKKVHRDAKGIITHIEESESFDGNEDSDSE
jgi:hypothetical protein